MVIPIVHSAGSITRQIVSCWFLIVAGALTAAHAAEQSEPVVAKFQMQLKVADEVIGTIEKGDLLTILQEQEDAYLALTHNGEQGWVGRSSVSTLADSVEIYSEVLNEGANDARLYTLRAAAWLARGEERQALADYDRAIQLGYDQPHVYISRGMFHAALGNFDQAISDYNTAIEHGVQGDSPFINRAAVYMSQNKYELAIQDYNEAIRISANKASTYQQRGDAKKLNGQLKEAVREFGTAIELDRKLVTAWMSRGYVWYQMGETKNAIADFSEVIKLQPNAAQAYNNRGYNNQLLGNYADALRDYNQAIDLAPNYPLAHQNKAWLLATAEDDRIRDGKQAIAAATRACELHKYEDFTDLKALAAALAEDGQFAKAIQWQEKVVELSGEQQGVAEREILRRYRSQEPLRLAPLDA